MMHPADHREGDDLPPIVGLALAECGGVLAEREVGPGSVIVNDCALDGVLRRDSAKILRALEESGWKIKGDGNAASRLGINPSTLRSRIRRLGIERSRVGDRRP
jgi:transcriptional regulator of acetoin/glycerol metabolism